MTKQMKLLVTAEEAIKVGGKMLLTDTVPVHQVTGEIEKLSACSKFELILYIWAAGRLQGIREERQRKGAKIS